MDANSPTRRQAGLPADPHVCPHVSSRGRPAAAHRLMRLVLTALPAAVAVGPAWADDTDYQWFPGRSAYPRYLADPHGLGFGVALAAARDSDIPGAGTNRNLLRLGGYLGILRMRKGENPVQLDLIAGFNGQFDNTENQDNIGWDGHYGAALSGRHGEGFWKLAVHHISAHKGDEYILATDTARLDYTREELNLGYAVPTGTQAVVYVETGWGYSLRSTRQEPWRLQAGFQKRFPGAWRSERVAAYAAVDLSATEERNWRVDEAFELGVEIDGEARPWRVGIRYQAGQPTMGEFFQRDETLISVGLWTVP